jgi:hypothetical protein
MREMNEFYFSFILFYVFLPPLSSTKQKQVGWKRGKIDNVLNMATSGKL